MSQRLKRVAGLIRGNVVADVGSDHGSLLVYLLKNDLIERGIGIENKRLPYENSVAAMSRLHDELSCEGTTRGEIRFGDGLEPLSVGEIDCLSICGVGGRNIVRILNAHPDRIPDRIVFQPSNRSECVRRWAIANKFWIDQEIRSFGRWPYNILSFDRTDLPTESDPAYDDVNFEAALLFGPLTIKRKDSEFAAALLQEQTYWSQASQRDPERSKRLDLVRRVIEFYDIEHSI